jgi:adenine-specific DNA-methyltransferase
MKINDRTVKDGKDEHLTEEPEQIKAYRDTWEKGIHSYLGYLKDRLVISRELLSQSGSCFMQISDDNIHLVRAVMDEVFGSENFVAQINFSKAGGGLSTNKGLSTRLDYILWYSKNLENLKFRQVYKYKDDPIGSGYRKVELKDGTIRNLTKEERNNIKQLPEGSKLLMSQVLTKPGPGSKYKVEHNGEVYDSGNRWWGTPKESLLKLIDFDRVLDSGKTLRYKRYFTDFPYSEIDNLWTGFGGEANQKYVVQTNTDIVERCLLMTTDPGDLVVDPTCGSGTTSYVAEKWGRRWITIDTSRIALNIAKSRMMTGTYPYFYLQSEVDVDRSKSEKGGINKEVKYKSKTYQNVKEGFVYEEVPHVTLKQLANDEEPETEILYDQPFEDTKRMRVSGPFTVETLQNLNPVHPEDIEQEAREDDEAQKFEEMVFQHLTSAGIKNGIKQEQAVFTQVDRLINRSLHAEGYYKADETERKAYFHIGPKFGTVSNEAVNEAIKECRAKGDADWLVVLGFSFESEIENQSVTHSMGSFEVTKVRMADDLLQDGLLKKDKKAASFVTIGEPDIELHRNEDDTVQLEVQGIDIYDPIKNQIKPRNAKDIAYWTVDDDYDGSNFVVRQIFFSGGDKDEFKDIKKELKQQAKYATKKKLEHTLRIEIDDEAFDRLYGLKSHPIEAEKGQKIAVRVVSQFGEEVTKVLEV